MYKNYTMHQVILPLNLEVKIPEDAIVRAVNGHTASLIQVIADSI